MVLFETAREQIDWKIDIYRVFLYLKEIAALHSSFLKNKEKCYLLNDSLNYDNAKYSLAVVFPKVQFFSISIFRPA
jgi:hypothetical protein